MTGSGWLWDGGDLGSALHDCGSLQSLVSGLEVYLAPDLLLHEALWNQRT